MNSNNFILVNEEYWGKGEYETHPVWINVRQIISISSFTAYINGVNRNAKSKVIIGGATIYLIEDPQELFKLMDKKD